MKRENSRYSDLYLETIPDVDIPEVTLEGLNITFDLSVRAMNILRNNNLFDFRSIYHYFKINKNFKDIKNSGVVVERELLDVILHYQKLWSQNVFNKYSLPLQGSIFSGIQILDGVNLEFVRESAKKQTKKVSNLILSVTNRFNDISQLTDLVNEELFGDKMVEEFGEIYGLKVIKFFCELTPPHENDLSVDPHEERAAFLMKKYKIVNPEIKNQLIQRITDSIQDPWGAISLLIVSIANFDKRALEILKRRFAGINGVNESSFSAIGKNLKLAPERIRQIYSKTIRSVPFVARKVAEDFKSEFDFFSSEYQKRDLITYRGDPFLFQEIDSVPSFIRFEIIKAVLADTHREIKSKFLKNGRVLMAKEISTVFKWEKFILNFAKGKLGGEGSENLSFDKYFVDFSLTQNEVVRERIKNASLEVFEVIYEFKPALRKVYAIKRDYTKQNLKIAAISILKNHEVPIHFNDLILLIKRIADYSQLDHDYLHAFLRKVEGIHCIGKSGKYYFSKTKIRFSADQYKTIGELVQKFLRYSKEPIHVYDLVKKLKGIRDTTETNLLTNLKSTGSGVFRFFSSGFIGLENKDYSGFHSRPLFRNLIFLVEKIFKETKHPIKFSDLVDLLMKDYDFNRRQLEIWILKKIENGILINISGDLISWRVQL